MCFFLCRWYREIENRLVPLVSSHRVTQLDGSLFLQFVGVQDSGRYVCVVNNSAGEDRTFTVVTVSGENLHIGRKEVHELSILCYIFIHLF